MVLCFVICSYSKATIIDSQRRKNRVQVEDDALPAVFNRLLPSRDLPTTAIAQGRLSRKWLEVLNAMERIVSYSWTYLLEL